LIGFFLMRSRRLSLLRTILSVVPLALILIPAVGYGWSGRVTRVLDGDTIEVRQGRAVEKIRLYGIDAPEKDQPYGARASRFLRKQVLRQQVEIRPVARDRYGRTVALVLRDGQSVNRLLLQRGYAWVYKRYCRKQICRQWQREQAVARQVGRGLWAADDPMPPWEWRHREPTFTEQLAAAAEKIFMVIRKIWSFI
jgi:endonuclease YncB( thermonuclease family)